MSSPDTTSGRQGILTRWILSKRLDLAFFVGTPLLIIPLFWIAGRGIRPENLLLIVSAFGALGHHAPGLMRAYGDRKLFRRFWLRFTLAPLLAFGIFLFHPPEQIPGVMLILLSWGIWHFLMQTYGFARIYDAKVGSFETSTQRLDLAMCIVWSGACILFAPNRMNEFLSLALKAGLTAVLHVPMRAVQITWLCLTVVVTVLFAFNVARRAMRGEPVNLVKLFLFVSTFSFFWLCSVTLTNLLIGVAMFELFHDVQYLAIVWSFNRNRVEKDPDAGPFTRFLFRPGSGLVGAYIGLVLAYGFVAFAAERLTSDRVQQLLFGIVAASNLLHFYYDGFIWKIREAETGSALGVASQQNRARVISGLAHAGKWAILLAIGGLLIYTQKTTSMSVLDQARAVAERVPQSVRAQNDLARELFNNREYLETIRVCRQTVSISDEPRYRTHMYLGAALAAVNQPNAALAELTKAFELYPDDAFLRFHLAMGLLRQGNRDEALIHLKESVALDPMDDAAQYNLGVLYGLLGRSDDAAESLKAALQLNPAHPGAHRAYSEICLASGKSDMAIHHVERSLDLDDSTPMTHCTAARVYLTAMDYEKAEVHIARARELAGATPNPELVRVLNALAVELKAAKTPHAPVTDDSSSE